MTRKSQRRASRGNKRCAKWLLVLCPQFFSLDTSSWGALARNECSERKRVLEALAKGAVIPFFTSMHLWELFQHEDERVFEQRLDFIRRLPFVAYLRCIYGTRSPGGILELHEAEMSCLRTSPLLNPDEVICQTRSTVTAGFCSGADFCSENENQWRIQRTVFPHMSANSAEIASVAHFPLPGVNLKEKVPPNSAGIEPKTKEEIAQFYGEGYEWLVEKLKADGDPRLNEAGKRIRTPEKAAAKFVKEAYDDAVAVLEKPGDLLENLLIASGVERSRLPKNPTIEDVGREAHFIGMLKIHERRLKLPQSTLKQIVRQENVPSWVVRREVDTAVKRLQKAEGSSLMDKFMLPFALYLDAMEVDKRIMDCVRQAAREHPLLSRVKSRIFRKRNLGDVAQKLEELAVAAQ